MSKSGVRRYSSEAVVGATTDVSPEVRWSMDRIGGGKGFVRGQGRQGINISYAGLGQGGQRTPAVE